MLQTRTGRRGGQPNNRDYRQLCQFRELLVAAASGILAGMKPLHYQVVQCDKLFDVRLTLPSGRRYSANGVWAAF
jgi:hypothetical protein